MRCIELKLRDFAHWAHRVFEEKLAEQQKSEEGKESTDGPSVEDRFQQWLERMEENSVPRQLQKLFARMLKSDKRAESTSVSDSSRLSDY